MVADRNPEAIAEVIAAGAETAASAKAIAEQCDVIITMLPNSPHVKEVALGEGGIIEGAKPGTVLIDMSSIAPLASREISEALKAKGVDMLDAPVSGGEPKAIDGTLSVMVGGDKAIFDKYYDLLKAMAGSVVHTGEIGAGNVTKLANGDRGAEHCGDVRSADAGDQSGRKPGSGVSGHSRRAGREHRAGCQSANGDGPQLQAGLPYRSAY